MDVTWVPSLKMAVSLVAAICVASSGSVWRAILTMAVMYVWSYWIHRWAHNVGVFRHAPLLRMHVLLHHNGLSLSDAQRALIPHETELTELCMNFAGTGGMWMLFVPGACRILDSTVVVFFAILYSLVHLVVYHATDSAFHAAHHSGDQNFGADDGITDCIFGSYHPGAFKWSELAWHVPATFAAAGLAVLICFAFRVLVDNRLSCWGGTQAVVSRPTFP